MAKKKLPVSTKATRRILTDDFKREAVQMMIDGHSASSVAKNLGIGNTNLLYRWKTEILMDLYSRKIIGWSIELRMDESLVITVLKQAITARQPLPDLIHHTDRGGQYASIEYRAMLTRAQIQQSMSRAGDCYDNAFMESCFGTIKTELEMTSYESIEYARREIEEYINYFNAIRRHSSLDYKSPTSFELAVQSQRQPCP